MNYCTIVDHDIDTQYTLGNKTSHTRETTKIELRDEFSEASVKEYLKEKFNVNPALVDEIYSGRRKGSVIPLSGECDNAWLLTGTCDFTALKYKLQV